MKRFIIIMAVIAAGMAVGGCDKGTVYGVNDVGSDPAAFTGTITVTGITAGVSPQDPTIFGIMDKKELQCSSANCKKIIMPIRCQGKLPVLGDEVRVTGSFSNDGRGYLFTAAKVKVVKNHKIGG